MLLTDHLGSPRLQGLLGEATAETFAIPVNRGSPQWVDGGSGALPATAGSSGSLAMAQRPASSAMPPSRTATSCSADCGTESAPTPIPLAVRREVTRGFQRAQERSSSVMLVRA